MTRTRIEDAAFRAAVVKGQVAWRHIHDRFDDEGDLVDRFSIAASATQSTEGYRLIWYHSQRKAELDAAARLKPVVGEGPLEPAFDAGRPGPARGEGGDLAGLAVLGHDHGEAQLGLGVDLVAMGLGEQFTSHLGPPFADLRWGAHGSAPGVGAPTLPDANPSAPSLCYSSKRSSRQPRPRRLPAGEFTET
jgi:hypothetical protein